MHECVFIFVILCVCVCVCVCVLGLDRAARVIYEVPHEDSEVDGTSTSSSKGSSQWVSLSEG